MTRQIFVPEPRTRLGYGVVTVNATLRTDVAKRLKSLAAKRRRECIRKGLPLHDASLSSVIQDALEDYFEFLARNRRK